MKKRGILCLFILLASPAFGNEDLAKRVGLVGVISAHDEGVVVLTDRNAKKNFTLRRYSEVPFLPGYFIQDIDFQMVVISNGEDTFTIDKDHRPFDKNSVVASEGPVEDSIIPDSYPEQVKERAKEGAGEVYLPLHSTGHDRPETLEGLSEGEGIEGGEDGEGEELYDEEDLLPLYEEGHDMGYFLDLIEQEP